MADQIGKTPTVRTKEKDGTFKYEDLELVLSRLSTRLEGTRLDSLSSAIVDPNDDTESDERHDEVMIADIAAQLENIQLQESRGPPTSKTLEEGPDDLVASEQEMLSYLSTLTGRRRYWAQKMLRAGILIGTIRVMHDTTDFYSLSKAERLTKVAEKYRAQSVGADQPRGAIEECFDEEMDLV